MSSPSPNARIAASSFSTLFRAAAMTSSGDMGSLRGAASVFSFDILACARNGDSLPGLCPLPFPFFGEDDVAAATGFAYLAVGARGHNAPGGRGPLKIVRHTASERLSSRTHFLFRPMNCRGLSMHTNQRTDEHV